MKRRSAAIGERGRAGVWEVRASNGTVAWVDVDQLIDRLFRTELPDVKVDRHRFRRQLLRVLRDVLPLELELLAIEAGVVAALLGFAEVEKRTNGKLVYGGPAALAREATCYRRRALELIFSDTAAGRKRPPVEWINASTAYVEEVRRLVPLWRRVYQLLRNHGTVSVLQRDPEFLALARDAGELPPDLLDELHTRRAERSDGYRVRSLVRTTPQAIACEHAARRLALHERSADTLPGEPRPRYSRLTLRNKYQEYERALRLAARPSRGRPKVLRTSRPRR